MAEEGGSAPTRDAGRDWLWEPPVPLIETIRRSRRGRRVRPAAQPGRDDAARPDRASV